MNRTGARNTEWSNWKDTGQKVSMGEKVGKILLSLRDTACINVEQRETIAFMKMYALLVPHDRKLISFFERQAIPAVTELGYAKWYRDVITDLALVLGKKPKDDKKTQVKFSKELLK